MVVLLRASKWIGSLQRVNSRMTFYFGQTFHKLFYMNFGWLFNYSGVRLSWESSACCCLMWLSCFLLCRNLDYIGLSTVWSVCTSCSSQLSSALKYDGCCLFTSVLDRDSLVTAIFCILAIMNLAQVIETFWAATTRLLHSPDNCHGHG